MVAIAPAGVKLIVVPSIFLVLTSIALGLRIWARRLKQKRLDVSDWLIIASMSVCTVLTIIIFIGVVVGGAGTHQSQVTSNPGAGDKALDNAAKIVFAAEMMWLTTNALTKLSTLSFYLSIFRVSRFRYAVFATMGLTVTCFVAFVAKDLLICQPISRNWTFEGGDFCGITTAGTLATGIGITIMDVIIVVLPMPMLLRLRQPLAKKLMICGIFSIGLIVCIISALRLVSVVNLDFKDLTYTIVPLGIFTLLEPLLGITASCLPILHPVLTKFIQSPLLDWTRGASRSRAGKGTSGSTTLRGTDGSSKINNNSTSNSSRKDTEQFNKLYDHLYPLTTMGTVTTTAEGGRGVRDSIEAFDLSALHGKKDSISVTTEVHVDSTPQMQQQQHQHQQQQRDYSDKPLPKLPEDPELGGQAGESWDRRPNDNDSDLSLLNGSRHGGWRQGAGAR